MTDDTTARGQADRIRLNIHEEHELEYWSKRFGCTRGELVQAVKQVGVKAANVEKKLKQP